MRPICFEAESMERLVEHVVRGLEAVVDNREQRVGEISLLSEAERGAVAEVAGRRKPVSLVRA